MSLTISKEAFEAQITERDVKAIQLIRDSLKDEIKSDQKELDAKKGRLMSINASLALIQLTLAERLNHGTARTA